jgi:hypothetical protein
LTRPGPVFIVDGAPEPQTKSAVLDILLIAVCAAVLFLVAVALFGSRPLLRWYLHEVRGMKIAEAPGEAIVTYPLA